MKVNVSKPIKFDAKCDLQLSPTGGAYGNMFGLEALCWNTCTALAEVEVGLHEWTAGLVALTGVLTGGVVVALTSFCNDQTDMRPIEPIVSHRIVGQMVLCSANWLLMWCKATEGMGYGRHWWAEGRPLWALRTLSNTLNTKTHKDILSSQK